MRPIGAGLGARPGPSATGRDPATLDRHEGPLEGPQGAIPGTLRHAHEQAVDDRELWESETDIGGTLVLSFPEGTDTGVRIKKRLN